MRTDARHKTAIWGQVQPHINMRSLTMRWRVLLAVCGLCASVVHAGAARTWVKGALHPVYTSMYLYLEDIDPQIYYQVLPAAG